MVDDGHFVDSLQVLERELEGMSLPMAQILGDQTHGYHPVDRLGQRREGQMKSRHGFERLENRTAAGGHHDAEQRHQALLERRVLGIGPLFRG
ncbi:hypothetical protein RZS08_17115, partial [Arthrospira platensis SPKY1]|nr:hypothetical protein [Arthrospira platensis SPKY1]